MTNVPNLLHGQSSRSKPGASLIPPSHASAVYRPPPLHRRDTSDHRVAATHRQHLSGDVRRAVRSEEEHSANDILRHCEPA